MKMEFGNTNSKEILENPLLCAQFLRGYSEVPLFAGVQPEDIEDITENLRPFVGVEYDGDAVKKVRLRISEESESMDGEGSADGAEREVYVVAALEHKSGVDYDVSFQLLKYMVGIWNIYRNEQNNKAAGSSARKSFLYPLIVPIVYYEGAERWTAAMHWKDRVEFSEMFGEYVPDFTYRVVELHNYTNEELLSKEEELSLVMMLNRVQTAQDLDVSSWPEEERRTAERIIRKAPEAVLRILTGMVHYLGLRMNLPDEELARCVKNMEDMEMGELWANMEKMDIQAERRKTKEAQEKLDAAQEKLAATQAEVARLEKLLQEKEDMEIGELWANMEKMDIQAERRKTKEVQEKLDAAQEALEELRKIQTETQERLEQSQKELERTRREAEEEIARLRKML